MKDLTAKSIVNAFLEEWVLHGHGVPSVILTDQVKSAVELAIAELCCEFGIEKQHTTPYHPRQTARSKGKSGS